MNAYYFVMNKHLVGKLKGYDSTFSLSVIEIKGDLVLLKVTNGIERNLFSVEAAATMDFGVVKNIHDGSKGGTSKVLMGFLLP